MDKLDDFLKYSVLFSYYSELFPKKKREYLELYLEENSSLSEIAEQCGVTRQAVFDNIKKACKKLDFYEENLNILESEKEYLVKLKKLKKEFTIENLDKLISELEGTNV